MRLTITTYPDNIDVKVSVRREDRQEERHWFFQTDSIFSENPIAQCRCFVTIQTAGRQTEKQPNGQSPGGLIEKLINSGVGVQPASLYALSLVVWFQSLRQRG